MTAFTLGTPSEDYSRRRSLPLPWGFVLATDPRRRRGLVHIIRADTFGAVAKLFVSGKPVTTLCGVPRVTPEWDLMPRLPDSGHLISCANCRGKLTHYRNGGGD